MFPKRFTIELTNHCNRTCAECPRHRANMPMGFMTWQLYKKILGELPQKTVIVPFFRGESLLHPQFADAMKELEKFDYVQLATNGDLLDAHRRRAILRACSFASLSLHKFSSSPPTSRIHKFLMAAKNDGVTTQISIIEDLIPADKKEQFIESWLGLADRVRIYMRHSHHGYGDTLLNIHDTGQPCMFPFTDMMSYWNGEVALCCQDWNNQMKLGNLNVQSVREVWRGIDYENVRELHQQGQRQQVLSCRDCHQWIAEYMSNCILGELYT